MSIKAPAISQAVMQQMQAKLDAGLQKMGLDLNAQQRDQLLDYVCLIHKWNQVYNLTAVRDPIEMITLHLLDSLSVLPYIDCKRLLDVGAGAGLPSIPLAICKPDLVVTAIDAVQKKVIFMRQVKAQLALANFSVIHGRVEAQKVPSREMPNKFDAIISRAFSEIGLFVKLTRHLLADGGVWLAMKGVVPVAEFEDMDAKPIAIQKLQVADLDAERHLIVLQQCESKIVIHSNY